jgi:hypothetical protein
MSGHYHDSDCSTWAQERTAEALERMADTLDDFMDMTLALQAIAGIRGTDPDLALRQIVEALQAIGERRKGRQP